jgi:hypothetical protein
MRGVYQHHAHYLVWVLTCIHTDVEASERVPDKYEWAFLPRGRE